MTRWQYPPLTATIAEWHYEPAPCALAAALEVTSPTVVDRGHVVADRAQQRVGHDRYERCEQRVLDDVLAFVVTNKAGDSSWVVLRLEKPMHRTAVWERLNPTARGSTCESPL